jgi:hypothetical protein
MNRNPADFELDQEISEFLDQFAIEYPTGLEISQTIEVLRVYTPKKKKPLQLYLSQMKTMLFFSFHPLFILYALVLYMAGLCLMIYGKQNPYFTFLTLSPTPFLFGIFELVRGRESKMWELEQACKYSAQRLFLAKLTTISTMNIGLNLLFSLFVEVSVPDIIFWKLTVFWIVPLCMVSAFSLILSLKMRGWVPITMVPVLWLGISILFAQIPMVMTLLESIHWMVYLMITLFSISMFIYQTLSLKRSFQIEINY